jgi:predicted RNase H-like nuclease (RuvC/YqgF family)
MNLQYLMTSEFTEGFSPDELKKILLIFRKEYRKMESKNILLEREISNKEKEINKLEEDLESLKTKNQLLLNSVKRYRGKKLTLKERLVGKIKF